MDNFVGLKHEQEGMPISLVQSTGRSICVCVYVCVSMSMCALEVNKEGGRVLGNRKGE